MGDNNARIGTRRAGEIVAWKAFIGRAEPGRLVYLPPGGWRISSETWDALKKIRSAIKDAEKAMLRLARRVLQWVAKCIVDDFLVPESLRHGRTVLDASQIERAVREILGPAWFDLPYDVGGQVRNWSVQEIIGIGMDIKIAEDGDVVLVTAKQASQISQLIPVESTADMSSVLPLPTEHTHIDVEDVGVDI